MNWMSLFGQVTEIDGEQTRALIENSPADSYQLVDVRQPAEYEREHIPGAVLIPLKELSSRFTELDPEKKTVVYCRSGARSKAGTQVLADYGFSDVLNMSGGMIAWKGRRAAGAETLGLELFVDGDFNSAYSMAMSMEAGLKRFYLKLAAQTKEQANRELLEFMARLEDGHMAKLSAQYPDSVATPTQDDTVGEGGLDMDVFMARYGDRVATIEDIIQIGMMFESQAYDLYRRLERKEQNRERKDFFIKMAAEEQSHLERLTKELEKHII